MAPDVLSLPNLIVGPADVSRLRRELEALTDYIRQAALRTEAGSPPVALKMPRTSRMLDEFAGINKLNLLVPGDHKRAEDFLAKLLEDAPIIHLSFATDPSAAFIDKMVVWFRKNVHPILLIRVGLQPTIAAGCVVRTPNHYYDFSLRQRFVKQRPALIQALEGMVSHE